MGVTPTKESQDGADKPRDARPRVEGGPSANVPTGQLFAAAVSDRCVTCGAPLASDQRYCVQCGERRGKSRFSWASTAAQMPQTPDGSAREPREPRRRRASSGASLIAGIATLLLAMGVGVEIGRIGNNASGNTPRASAPAVQVVTLGASGGGAPAASTTPSTTTASRVKTSAKKTAKTHVTPKVAAKAAAAASKVLGGSSQSAPPTVTTGQKCTGAGCQGGRFTGTFFGQ